MEYLISVTNTIIDLFIAVYVESFLLARVQPRLLGSLRPAVKLGHTELRNQVGRMRRMTMIGAHSIVGMSDVELRTYGRVREYRPPIVIESTACHPPPSQWHEDVEIYSTQ